MNFVQAVVRNPVKVLVGALLIALFGAIALDRMPMQLVPEVQTPIITIETRWPGASPQEIEREIVQEQEEQLKGVEGVLKMSAECSDSVGKISLEFAAGEDMAAALLRVNTRLQQVREYPEDADNPVLATSSSSDQAIAWFVLRPRLPGKAELDAFQATHPDLKAALEPLRTATNSAMLQRRLEELAAKEESVRALLPPPVDLTLERRFVEDVIEARFERVKGVSNSNVYGGREDEMQVILDPQRLAGRGVTVLDVRRALAARNVDMSAGDYWEGKRRYVVRTLGRFQSAGDVAGAIVKEDGPSGQVLVSDVADVEHGFKKSDGTVRNMGTTVIAVNVVRERGANVLDVMDGLYRARDDLNAGVLKARGLQLDQVYDETEYIHSAVGLLNENIVTAAGLAILILLLFLRTLRSTLVIAVAIPTSMIGTFLLLSLMGRSLNVVSLAGLAFAVGMLVDNAVVVFENIFRRWQEGESPFEASVKGTQEVWGAVVSSTLTTLAVFVPILFIQEQAGQLFRDIALAISFSVGLSLVVSVTLIPMLTARILAQRKPGEGPGTRGVLASVLGIFDPLARGIVGMTVGLHRWLERGVLRQVAVVALILAGVWFGTIALMPKLEYLPNGNRNLVFGILVPPPGYNLDEVLALGAQIEKQVAPYWEIDPNSAEAKALDTPPINQFFLVAAGRQMFMGMRAVDPLRAAELTPLMQRIGSTLPGVFLMATQVSLFESGLTAGRSIDIEITGPDLRHLVAVGGRVLGQTMGGIPGVQARPVPSLDLSNPEVHVKPRWSRAASVGLATEELGYTVNALVDGAYAGDFFLAGEKIDLTLIGKDRFASRFEDLGELSIATPSGDLVPLRSVADIEYGSGPEQIHRRERERAITINLRPPDTMALEDAITFVTETIVRPLQETPFEQGGVKGGGYQIRLAGTADKLEATWKAMSFNLLIAVIITYLLMAALFESWFHPLIIIFSVPLGAVGGIAGLWALNRFLLPAGTIQPLDVLTMIGFVILVGTVVNNAILIVHQALNHIREDKDDYAEAVRKSVATRFRPIFMTTLTTVLGLVPLVFRPGAGSELYRGLGSVLVGGLVVSTIVTLLLIPVLFRLVMGSKRTLARWFGIASKT